MRDFEIKPELDKKLVKLSKKDKNSYEAVMNLQLPEFSSLLLHKSSYLS